MNKIKSFKFIRFAALVCALLSMLTVLPLNAFAAYEDEPECEHDFYQTFYFEPGCDREGERGWECIKCGFSTYEFLPPLGHEPGESIMQKPARCDTDGRNAVYCKRCGNFLYYETIPAHGHNYETFREEPDCFFPGFTTQICRICGDATDYVELPAIGHCWDLCENECTPASCTEQGVNVYYCRYCYEEKYEPSEPTGHTSNGCWKTEKNPTCGEPGQMVQYCIDCGEPVLFKEIPPTGICEHFSEEITEYPTAAKAGTVKLTCEDCGKVYYEPLSRTKPGDTVLKTVSNTADGVKICWNTVYGADKYLVYRKAPGEKSWSRTGTAESGVTEYTDTHTVSGTKYTYTVKAQNVSGCGGFDKKGLCITCIEAPAVKTANKNGYVEITWRQIAGAKSYRVYCRAQGEKTRAQIAEVKAGEILSVKDEDISSGKKYTYYVTAFNGSTESAAGTADTVYLAQPKVTLSNGNSKIAVKWSGIKGAKGYYVYRKAGSETKWTRIAAVTGADTLSYTDKNVKAGVKYTYTVKAYNGSFVGSFCSGVKLKYIAPAKLASATGTKSGTVLKWNGVSGADGYRIYRKTGSGSFKLLAWVNGASVRSFTDETAKNGTQYTYCICACSGDTKGTYANTLTVKAK